MITTLLQLFLYDDFIFKIGFLQIEAFKSLGWVSIMLLSLFMTELQF